MRIRQHGIYERPVKPRSIDRTRTVVPRPRLLHAPGGSSPVVRQFLNLLLESVISLKVCYFTAISGDDNKRPSMRGTININDRKSGFL